jgi:hypothetical protein
MVAAGYPSICATLLFLHPVFRLSVVASRRFQGHEQHPGGHGHHHQLHRLAVCHARPPARSINSLDSRAAREVLVLRNTMGLA